MTRTVAVCGSCVSRDNFNSRFNPDYARWFSVTADVFQTSIISLMSPALDPVTDLDALFTGPGTGSDGEKLDYRIRITREDATRDFLTKLAEARPDYLVLDFFADIHFGALELPDGRIITDNRWMLHPTAYYKALKERGGLTQIRIFRDPEDYLVRWREALDRFADFIAEHCPDTQVVVHRGLNVDEVVVPGQGRPVKVRDVRKAARLDVVRANELWARLDDYALDTYGPTRGWTAIDLRDEGYTSYAEHPWKPFYVHYTPDYHRRFLAEMLALSLDTQLDQDDLAQVRAINAAGHQRAAGLAARWTPIRQERARRIEELTGLGPLAAARFALGQRLRRRLR